MEAIKISKTIGHASKVEYIGHVSQLTHIYGSWSYDAGEKGLREVIGKMILEIFKNAKENGGCHNIFDVVCIEDLMDFGDDYIVIEINNLSLVLIFNMLLSYNTYGLKMIAAISKCYRDNGR